MEQISKFCSHFYPFLTSQKLHNLTEFSKIRHLPKRIHIKDSSCFVEFLIPKLINFQCFRYFLWQVQDSILLTCFCPIVKLYLWLFSHGVNRSLLLMKKKNNFIFFFFYNYFIFENAVFPNI